MDIYEYQGKQLFAQYDIPIPRSALLEDPENVPFFENGSVVKAQVLTGGRGKAGAIKKCFTAEETKKAANEIKDMTVKGFKVFKVLIEEAVETSAEYYFSISFNRAKKLISIIFTDQGGMDIESVPHDKLGTLDVNPFIGVQDYMLTKLLFPFGLHKDAELKALILKAYKLFADKKLSLVEINPLARKADGSIIALDSKVVMDDAAIDPSIDLSDMGEGNQTEFERTMRGWGVTAVELDSQGDIILLGNGAGAAVCSTDSIIKKGGSVRALIDLGTMGAKFPEEIREACQIKIFHYWAEQNPKCIFINMYFQGPWWNHWAGIIRKAYTDSGIAKQIPIVLRVQGNKSDVAKEILKDSDMYVVETYAEGCDLAIKLAKEGVR